MVLPDVALACNPGSMAAVTISRGCPGVIVGVAVLVTTQVPESEEFTVLLPVTV